MLITDFEDTDWRIDNAGNLVFENVAIVISEKSPKRYHIFGRVILASHSEAAVKVNIEESVDTEGDNIVFSKHEMEEANQHARAFYTEIVLPELNTVEGLIRDKWRVESRIPYDRLSYPERRTLLQAIWNMHEALKAIEEEAEE